MHVYVFVDNPDFGENEDAVIAQIESWVGEDNPHVTFVNDCNGQNGTKRLGVELKLKQRKFLSPPLLALNKVAQQYKCDFVVGYIEENVYEDVCFFGKEEGKPDAYEIGCYLGFD